MTDVGRVGRRVLPLLMFASGACLGEQITVGRVVTSTDGAGETLVPTATSMSGIASPIDLPTDDPDPATCDLDGDGHDSIACGGDDCDDRSADVSPDVEENEDWGVEVMAENASL